MQSIILKQSNLYNLSNNEYHAKYDDDLSEYAECAIIAIECIRGVENSQLRAEQILMELHNHESITHGEYRAILNNLELS